jgi:hypothetical protein
MRPLRKEEVDGELRDALAGGEKWMGEPVIGAGIQAYAPPIFFASRALGAAPAKSGLLSGQLRSLVCLRAAQIVGCPF